MSRDEEQSANPNPSVYETCSNCGYAYKIIGERCSNCADIVQPVRENS